MTAHDIRVQERALEMRREFDAAFARPVEIDETIREKLLAIRIGGQPFSIRLSSIAGLFADKKITAVPGGHPALRGIAGFRGIVLPVYDLARLLAITAAKQPRWLVIAKAAPVAVAFETFEAQLLARPHEVVTQSARSQHKDFARDFVRMPGFAAPILDLPSVLDALGISQTDHDLN